MTYVTWHLHLGQNDRYLLHAIAGKRGWNGYRNELPQKVEPGEENSPAAPAVGTRVRRSTTGPSALPNVYVHDHVHV